MFHTVTLRSMEIAVTEDGRETEAVAAEAIGLAGKQPVCRQGRLYDVVLGRGSPSKNVCETNFSKCSNRSNPASTLLRASSLVPVNSKFLEPREARPDLVDGLLVALHHHQRNQRLK